MLLPRNRYIEIKKITFDIFDDYEIHSFPVDVFLLAKKMQIIVEQYNAFSVSDQMTIISASDDV